MKRCTLPLLVAAALAATTAAANPQDPVTVFKREMLAAADEVRAGADAWRRWADEFSHEMRASMAAMYGGRVGALKAVKGAPYSAEVVTESNQMLADGNVISRKTTGRVYRDGEGRTRQESGGDGKAPTVYIGDPVEKKNIVIAPRSKKVIVTPRHDFTHELELKEGERKVVVKTVTEGDDGLKREEVRIQIVRPGDPHPPHGAPPVPPMPPVPPVPPMPGVAPPSPMGFNFDFNVPGPPLPGAHTMRFESTAKLGKGTTTSLGMKDFDGVKAEGKSTVWVIPAGQIGNRNPIQVSSETWHSPDLKVTVYSRHHDPRIGESIYRLEGIKRGEPPAELFKAPEGYEVKNRKG